MKRILIGILVLICAMQASAKKVKFAVDMTGVVINTTGMHISGDFQTEIGLQNDWVSDSTSLLQESADTNIYSIVVDIPAFRLYEYKFLNGDQFYDAEFVPVESRVGYNFDDNRWLYVDSLDDDTTFVGNIVFAANAPVNLFLLRSLVDMQNLPSVDPSGVHLAGDFQGNNPATTYMYSFTTGIYEVISYMPAGSYEYKFYNGNTSGASETVPSTCATNGNRIIALANDSVMTAFCFSECGLCAIGINEYAPKIAYSLYPIPAAETTTIEFEHAVAPVQINIIDQFGKIVRSYNGITGSKLTIDRGNLSKGVYFISVKNYSGEKLLQTKLIFG